MLQLNTLWMAIIRCSGAHWRCYWYSTYISSQLRLIDQSIGLGSDTVRTVLLATDSDDVFRNVDAAIGSDEMRVLRVDRGQHVVEAVRQLDPDLVLLDMQIDNMGGFAVSKVLRQEEGFGRLEQRKIMLLLDRQVDEYLARTSGADAWYVKPLDPLRLLNSVDQVFADASV